MKVILVNNTSAEFPLIGGVPNLAPFARQVLQISTHTFESLKAHLDSMSSKGLISYMVDSEVVNTPAPVRENPTSEDTTATRNALRLLQADVTNSSVDYEAKIAKLETLFSAKIDLLNKKIEILQAQIHASSPESTIFRSEAKNQVSISRNNYEPINGLTLTVPYTGNWLVLGDVSVYSPIPSKGQVTLNCFGQNSGDKAIDSTERVWSRSSDLPTSLSFSTSLNLSEGDVLSIYWKALEGVLRATYRSITILKL